MIKYAAATCSNSHRPHHHRCSKYTACHNPTTAPGCLYELPIVRQDACCPPQDTVAGVDSAQARIATCVQSVNAVPNLHTCCQQSHMLSFNPSEALNLLCVHI
jgi:hypothetical protein